MRFKLVIVSEKDLVRRLEKEFKNGWRMGHIATRDYGDTMTFYCLLAK